MVVTRSRADLDYADAFGFLFKRPGGVQVILIGGVLLMFFFLIVPFLVVLGYGVALGRATAAGDPELPRFQIGMAADGLKACVVMFLYALPIVGVYVLTFIPMLLLSESSYPEPPGLAIFGMFGLMFLVMVYSLALAAVQPALFAIYINEGSIGSCFSLARIKAVLKQWGGDYAGAAAIVFGMAYASQFGFILLFVGVFFTSFYHLAFTSHVSGQLARPFITGVPAPVSAEPSSPEPPTPDPDGPHSPS